MAFSEYKYLPASIHQSSGGLLRRSALLPPTPQQSYFPHWRRSRPPIPHPPAGRKDHRPQRRCHERRRPAGRSTPAMGALAGPPQCGPGPRGCGPLARPFPGSKAGSTLPPHLPLAPQPICRRHFHFQSPLPPSTRLCPNRRPVLFPPKGPFPPRPLPLQSKPRAKLHRTLPR